MLNPMLFGAPASKYALNNKFLKIWPVITNDFELFYKAIMD